MEQVAGGRWHEAAWQHGSLAIVYLARMWANWLQLAQTYAHCLAPDGATHFLS